MPYALVAFEGGLVAGLADGQLWGSEDRGESWERYKLEGDPLTESRSSAPPSSVTWRTTFIPSFVWLSTVSVGWPGRRPARSEGLSSAPGRRRSVRNG